MESIKANVVNTFWLEGIHKLSWQYFVYIIDHLPTPCWHLWKNSFTETKEKSTDHWHFQFVSTLSCQRSLWMTPTHGRRKVHDYPLISTSTWFFKISISRNLFLNLIFCLCRTWFLQPTYTGSKNQVWNRQTIKLKIKLKNRDFRKSITYTHLYILDKGEWVFHEIFLQ